MIKTKWEWIYKKPLQLNQNLYSGTSVHVRSKF